MSEQGSTVFKDRYEVHRKLARGGMSDVYLARDRVLDRPVALKVLFPEYAKDATFVARFRREAQAAAKLNHPNIVAVYDWGEESGTYFIAMEYVEGRTLSEVVRAEGPLHPRRAAEIVADVAAALGFAHRNGVVHRDVKPGNVMVERSGQVKVADFGIAQAISGPEQAQLTRAGSVMGTATYFSPEQAQGRQVDPRSDLYSLGCVLFEILTARPPFTAESPVAIAYKHVQEAPPTPRSINPNVPAPLEAIILKCLSKNPEGRYDTAELLRADLRRFLEGQNVLAAAPVGGAAGAMADATAAFAGAALAGAAAHNPDATTAMPVTGGYPGGPGTSMTGAVPLGDDQQPQKKPNGALIAALVLFLIALAAGLFFLATRSNSAAAKVTVPDVTGRERTQAERILTDAKLKPEVSTEDNNDVEAGLVIRTTPPAQSSVEEGSVVKVIVSAGQGGEPVPDVVGLTEAAATTRLQQAGFTVQVVPTPDETVEKGLVISQNPPADNKLPKNQLVTINVSTGKGAIKVPNVTGFSQADAVKELGDAGLNRNTIESEFSAGFPAGQVIRTEPAANQSVPPDTFIKIVVSKGPEPTTTTAAPTTTTTRATTTTSRPTTTTRPTTTSQDGGD